MHARTVTPTLDQLGALLRIALVLTLTVTILVALLRIAPFV
jgi:hypothetical protein